MTVYNVRSDADGQGYMGNIYKFHRGMVFGSFVPKMVFITITGRNVGCEDRSSLDLSTISVN